MHCLHVAIQDIRAVIKHVMYPHALFCVFNKICQATANLVVTFHSYYINNDVHY